MSAGLQDLLDRMREHPAFPELLTKVAAPDVRSFKPSESAEAQASNWIYTSGRRYQNELWRQFLMVGEPPQQEKTK